MVSRVFGGGVRLLNEKGMCGWKWSKVGWVWWCDGFWWKRSVLVLGGVSCVV